MTENSFSLHRENSGIQNDTCDQSTLGESEGYAQEWIKSIIPT